MPNALWKASLAAVVLTLAVGPTFAQTKVTNQGISAEEIVIGTHQDLSGPIKGWGVPVSNGMKLAVDELNNAGGIHGRKLKLILEDSGYDPKKAVLATQKMIEKDKIFVNLGSMGSPGARRTRHHARCRRAAAVSADRGRIHLQVGSDQSPGAFEIQQPLALRGKHAGSGQVHDRIEGFQEALHPASG